MELLLNHSWPGNVRELSSVVERAFFSCPFPQIGGKTLEEALFPSFSASPGSESSTGILKEMEREAIEAALEKEEYRIGQAARRLGIDRTTLWRKLKKIKGTAPARS